MKKFFSFQSIKDNKAIFIMFAIIMLLGIGLISSPSFPEINYFSLKALIIASAVWGFCSLADREKYFNIGAMAVSFLFGYGIFWFLFEVLGKLVYKF